MTKFTATLVVLLILAAFVGVEIEGYGGFKLSSLTRERVVGILGLLIALCASSNLYLACYTAQKKRQSGLYYQRVLRFSNNPFAMLSERVLELALLCSLLVAIALPFIIAREEMLSFVVFVCEETVSFFDPWRARVRPAPRLN